MDKSNLTVKEFLEENYVIDKDFWFQTHISPETKWFQITVYQLHNIADALDENIKHIIDPNF